MPQPASQERPRPEAPPPAPRSGRGRRRTVAAWEETAAMQMRRHAARVISREGKTQFPRKFRVRQVLGILFRSDFFENCWRNPSLALSILFGNLKNSIVLETLEMLYL
jgi:hypothetical protein